MARDSEITVISVGPGACDLITLRAQRAIEEQELIIGSRDAVETFAHGKKHVIPEKLVSGTIKAIEDAVEHKIGVLATGDAGFFSLAYSVVKNFENVKIIPGVSSIAAGFASLKKQWGGYRFISVHGRDINTCEITGSTVILCDGENTPDRFLEKHPYLSDKFSIFILKDLSLPSEAVYTEPQGFYDSTRLLLILEEK